VKHRLIRVKVSDGTSSRKLRLHSIYSRPRKNLFCQKEDISIGNKFLRYQLVWRYYADAHEEVLKGRLKERGNFDDSGDAVLKVGCHLCLSQKLMRFVVNVTRLPSLPSLRPVSQNRPIIQKKFVWKLEDTR
jgi:hypothetical protein